MSLSTDLLSQARALADKEPNKPKQASLRRAVSAAYYSLFHLLTEDAAAAMFGGSDAADLRTAVRRAFQHSSMKKAAQGIGAANPAEPWKQLLAARSPELRLVAASFVDLQQARHQADYNLGGRLTRAEAIDLVERAEAATAAWKSIRKEALDRSRTTLRPGSSSPHFSSMTRFPDVEGATLSLSFRGFAEHETAAGAGPVESRR